MSKKFILGNTVRGVLQRNQREEFWALSDVSFVVEQGDALGVIGHNGAGKSTILKMLTKIMQPTSGRVRTRGRVSALIEVGAGFNPEMTGRENIYLNGSILGMGQHTIDARFDEIVAFAELEQFIDTPVKRYSSGMYARLGFAVAAHVDRDVLIVDEVLSVGDMSFQKRCLDKMMAVSRAGATVVFVSHNLNLVANLCKRGVLLDHGRVKCVGSARDAIRAYADSGRSDYGLADVGQGRCADEPYSAIVQKVYTSRPDGSLCDSFFIGEPMVLNAEIEVGESVRDIQMSFVIRNGFGTGIYHCMSQDDVPPFHSSSRRMRVSALILENRLYPGDYVFDEIWLANGDGDALDCTGPCLKFRVLEGGANGKTDAPYPCSVGLRPARWTMAAGTGASLSETACDVDVSEVPN